MIERLDALFAAGECPDAIVVFVDAWTTLRRLAVPQLDRHRAATWTTCATRSSRSSTSATRPPPSRDHRGLTGKSSGGYGAMVVPMLRPDVFGALASHAGDALFEACYLPEFPRRRARAARPLRGLLRRLLRAPARRPTTSTGTGSAPLELYGYAAAYSPDPAHPGKALLPFDVATGRLVDDVWAQWLDKDPVRMAPAHADALRSMRRIYLDAGREDEYYLDLGAQAFAAELDKLGVDHTLELFDGKHGGLTYRYPGAIRELVLAAAHYRRAVAVHTLDVTAVTCPMTWVRTKLELERLAAGRDAGGRAARRARRWRTCRARPREAGHDGRGRRDDRPDRAPMSEQPPRGFLRDSPPAAARAPRSARADAEPPAARLPAARRATRLERYSRQLVLPGVERGGAARAARRERARGRRGRARLAGRAVPGGRGRRAARDRRRRRRRALQPAPPAAALHARPRRRQGASRRRPSCASSTRTCVVEPYQVRLDADNAAGLIEGQDLVVDCSDSFATRYAVNAACCAAGVRAGRGRRGGAGAGS